MVVATRSVARRMHNASEAVHFTALPEEVVHRCLHHVILDWNSVARAAMCCRAWRSALGSYLTAAVVARLLSGDESAQILTVRKLHALFSTFLKVKIKGKINFVLGCVYTKNFVSVVVPCLNLLKDDAWKHKEDVVALVGEFLYDETCKNVAWSHGVVSVLIGLLKKNDKEVTLWSLHSLAVFVRVGSGDKDGRIAAVSAEKPYPWLMILLRSNDDEICRQVCHFIIEFGSLPYVREALADAGCVNILRSVATQAKATQAVDTALYTLSRVFNQGFRSVFDYM